MIKYDKKFQNKNACFLFFLVSKQVCEPRSTFKKYCNNCFCSEDGLYYACTKMYCDKEIWNEDGTLKVVVSNLKSTSKNVCKPGETFNYYCNTCSCAQDGLSFACTKMYCDKELWNEDGTKKAVIANMDNIETSMT